MTTFIVDGTAHNLTMRDDNNIDWSEDFIGNTAHGMDSDDDGNYIASADDFAWWKDMIANWQAMEEKITEYKEKYGWEEVTTWLEITHAWLGDLEDQPNSVRHALSQMDDEA
tara:strand:+ start:1826 stop:2161 length:336 start_codon:yes stop_codon:yes gene_type:complete